MLKHMTSEQFMDGVKERRFVVKQVTYTKYEVFFISTQHLPKGEIRYNMVRVINPDTKDGTFIQRGVGFNKAHATLEDIAMYIDLEVEKGGRKCREYLQNNQNWNEI